MERLTAQSNTKNGQTRIEVIAFSALAKQSEDEYTKSLESRVTEFVRLPGGATIGNRAEALGRSLDVLVYLDVGMDPSTTVWSASKLAPIQMALWGHPTTTGLSSIDYFISSESFHSDNFASESAFSEQLVRMQSLGFFFHRPSIGSVSLKYSNIVNRPPKFINSLLTVSSNNMGISNIATLKQTGAKMVLVPQHLPKFHVDFDPILHSILSTVDNSYIVITYDPKKMMWRRTLEQRWIRESGFSEDWVVNRILWLERLNPDQYMVMLALGDLMLDQYPFGGGVTVLEAIGVGTPVITCPSLQTVPSLAAGMLNYMFRDSEVKLSQNFILKDAAAYKYAAIQYLQNDSYLLEMRALIANYSASLYDDKYSIESWVSFLNTLQIGF
jgi:predicted O-linked N-acetylglucosamine transferase (SPINDLY family)